MEIVDVKELLNGVTNKVVRVVERDFSGNYGLDITKSRVVIGTLRLGNKSTLILSDGEKEQDMAGMTADEIAVEIDGDGTLEALMPDYSGNYDLNKTFPVVGVAYHNYEIFILLDDDVEERF